MLRASDAAVCCGRGAREALLLTWLKGLALQIRIWGLATRTDSDVCKLALNSCERFRHTADSTSTPTTVIATAAAALATTISMVLPMIVMIVAEIINKLALDNTKKNDEAAPAKVRVGPCSSPVLVNSHLLSSSAPSLLSPSSPQPTARMTPL